MRSLPELLGGCPSHIHPFPFRLRMDLLMAEQVNQYQITVTIASPEGEWYPVVNLKLFIVEERFKALWTATFLSFGKLLLGRWEVAGLGCLSFLPVVRKVRIIRRRCSFHHDVSL